MKLPIKITWNKIINLALLAMLLIFGFVCVNGTAIFSGTKSTDLLPTWEFFMFFALTIASLAGILIFNVLKNNYRPSIPFVILFSTLFLCGFLTLLSYKSGSYFFFISLAQDADGIYSFSGPVVGFSYELAPVMRITFIVQYFLLLLMTFVVVDIAPKLFDGKKLMLFASLVMVVIGVVCIIISLFKEPQQYYFFLKALFNGDGELALYAVFSFFTFKNTYGFILFLCILSSLYLHHYNAHWWWFIATGLFFVELVFNWDKSAIALGFVAIIAYLIFRFVITFKEHKKRNIIAASIVGGVFLLLVLAFVIAGCINNKIFDALFSSIINSRGNNTIDTRSWVWHKDKLLLSEFSPLFGVGFKLFARLLYNYNQVDVVDTVNATAYAAHNGYYELIGTGGFVLLAAFFAITAYTIYLSIKYIKEDKNLGFFPMLFISIMLIYMFFESGTYLFSQTFDYAYLSLLIFVPIYSYHYQKKAELAL
jgi:hypothetical protein